MRAGDTKGKKKIKEMISRQRKGKSKGPGSEDAQCSRKNKQASRAGAERRVTRDEHNEQTNAR